MWQNFSEYFFAEIVELLEWAKCGSSYVSVTPTVLWGAGAAALAHRMLEALFRRFLFRRVPLWERVLQNLLFVWMVIYSLQFWVVLVKIIKMFIQNCYQDASILLQATSTFQEVSMRSPDDAESSLLMQQWVIWMCGALPLAAYIHSRPRPVPPPLMIWITGSPWLRREMGPYGYYLNRPPSLESTTILDTQIIPLRKAFSDSNILIKEPPKRNRYSKSV